MANLSKTQTVTVDLAVVNNSVVVTGKTLTTSQVAATTFMTGPTGATGPTGPTGPAVTDASTLTTGTLPAGRLPALSGDITSSAGSATTAITSNVIVNADVNTAANIDATKLGTGVVNNTEFNYLDGVTSAIQTQLNAKQATISLTTTGTSGAATFASNTLNIPQYSGGGGTVADATTSSKGIIQLAGDLGGTAASPTVSGLATKQPNLTAASSQTATFTATPNTYYPVDATAGAITVTLPTGTINQQIVIKKTDSSINIVTISGTINGTSSATLALRTQLQGKYLIADGAGNWNIIAGDISLPALDARYQNAATYTISGIVKQREYNVFDYGATGNGTTDDTTSINSALSAAATAGGGLVYVPPGNYMISSNLFVLNGVTIEGAGFSSRIFLKANTTLTNAGIICAKDTVGGTHIANFIVRNLQIDGNKANQSGSPVQLYGFYCEADAGIIEKCWVHDNLGYGIDPHGTGGVTDKTRRLIVRDNYSYNNGTTASVDYDGITLDTITYGTVSGNVVYGNARNGINMTTSGIGVSIVGNSVFSNGLDGIVMQNSSTGASIVANEVYANTGNGIIISNVNYAAISGNIINGNGSSGILLYRTSYNSVTGNTLINNSQTTNNGFSDIYLNDDGVTYNTYNTISGNAISALATNKSKYGIEEKSTASNFNVYSGNVMTGNVTGKQNLKGANRTEYFDKNLGDTITDAANITLGTTTGTMIGTAIGQKIGFLGATPVVQQGANSELGSMMALFGFRGAGSTYTLSTSGLVSFSGGFKQAPIARTGNATVSSSSSPYQLCDATSGNIIITLPTAVGNTGQQYTIVKTDVSTNTVIFATVLSQTINGTTPVSLTAQWSSQSVISDGANWVFPRSLSTSGGTGNTTNISTVTMKIDAINAGTTTYGTLGGLVNSSNTVYTVSNGSYQTGTLEISLNGASQILGSTGDVSETSPGSGTFTFAIAPVTGDKIIVSYTTSATTTGNFVLPYATKTTTYSLAATDRNIFADATSAAFTITLPAATSYGGYEFYVQKVDSSANVVTIASAGGSILGGITTLSAQFRHVRYISNGTNWYVEENN